MKQNKIYKGNKILYIFKIILRIILFPLVLIYLLKQTRQRIKLKKEQKKQICFYEKTQLNSLSGTDFELSLKNLFENMGYVVKLTKASKDFGADLIISKNNISSIVQAKRYNHTVGIRAVQEIIAAREYYKIRNCFVVTNSEFSTEAKQLAEKSEVQLIGGELLQKLITKYDVKLQKTQKNTGIMSDEARAEIMQKYRWFI